MGMPVIYKYQLPLDDYSPMEPMMIPTNGYGTLVHFGADPHGDPCIWVRHEVVPHELTRLVERTFMIIGTGMEFVEGWEWTHSWLDPNGAFVWHLHELEPHLAEGP